VHVYRVGSSRGTWVPMYVTIQQVSKSFQWCGRSRNFVFLWTPTVYCNHKIPPRNVYYKSVNLQVRTTSLLLLKIYVYNELKFMSNHCHKPLLRV